MIEIIDKPTQRRKLMVIDPVGLHARPATLLCKYAAEIKDAEVEIWYGEKHINAKSIMGIMSLGIKQNSEFEIWVQGNDSNYVDSSIDDLVEKLIEDDIVEEIDMGTTVISEEVDATFDYLKRFPREELVQIVAGSLHKCCNLDNWDFDELLKEIQNCEFVD